MNRILQYKSSQVLSVGAGTALLHEITIDVWNFQLLQILLHFTAAVSETITVTHVDKDDPTLHATVLDTVTLSSGANYVFRPTGECVFKKGDIIRVACTAATDPSSTVYSKVQGRELV